jgi:hypothetical protein
VFQNQVRIDAYSSALSISSSRAFEGDNQLAISQVIPSGSTNLEILAAIDVSQLKMLILKSDVACTVKTNSSGSPTDTINLVAGVPLVWCTGDYYTNKITADVAKFFVTVPGVADCNFQVIALMDV